MGAQTKRLPVLTEDGILSVAASIPRKLPAEKQSWRLIQIKEKLELEGFPKPEQQNH
jgi:hypothetical protein